MSAKQLMELYLSSCPDSGPEDSDIEDGACLSLVEGENVGWWAVVGAGAEAPADDNGRFFNCRHGGGQRPPRVEEQGTVFKQNVAVMRDTFREEVGPRSLDAVPRAAVQKAVEVPFLPLVVQRVAEPSANLCGEADRHDAVPSGDHIFHKGKLLPKPKARMDAYCVNRNIFNFNASSIIAPLKEREVREAKSGRRSQSHKKDPSPNLHGDHQKRW